MMELVIRYGVYVLLVGALAYPLGLYMYNVMFEKKNALTGLVGPLEKATYKVLGIDPDKPMNGKRYLSSLLLFSLIGFLVLFLMLVTQASLVHDKGFVGMDIAQAFNTAASFVTNTNWQSYTPETQMTPVVQALGLSVQNFLAPAAGMAVLFALVRGLIQTKTGTIGNFWKDMTRILLYILIPVNLVLSLLLVSQGVVQTMNGTQTAKLLEPVAVNAKGEWIENAIIDEEHDVVIVDGTIVPDAKIITEQALPSGLAASQIAIKQSGTNGGGYFLTNAAHPYENPTPFTNVLEVVSILLIPAALCFTFGKALKDMKQGRAIFWAMLICLLLSTLVIALGEHAGLMVGRTPEFAGKKIEPYEMKWAVVMVLAAPFAILLGSTIACLDPATMDSVSASGPHAFTQILYAFTSAGANNGSALSGFASHTVLLDTLLGAMMLFARFVPMAAAIFMAQHLSRKQMVASTSGTLCTSNALFVFLLILIVVVIGALSFFPALALGPIAEWTQMIH